MGPFYTSLFPHSDAQCLLLAPVGWTDATVQSITRGENAVRNTPGLESGETDSDTVR